MGKIIAIEGNIGVGKSTILNIIKNNFEGIKIFNEGLDEKIYKKVVKDYYEKPKEFAYPFQLTMLWRKMAEGLSAQRFTDTCGGIAVIERTISSNANVFCNIAKECGYIDEDYYGVYQKSYNNLKQGLRKPDRILYLKCPVELCYSRISERGRGGENNISFEYLNRLQVLYDKWIEGKREYVDTLYFNYNMSEDEILEKIKRVFYD